jgi:mono/diheme cytochrome c family protein
MFVRSPSLAALVLSAAIAFQPAAAEPSTAELQRGRFLVTYGGCNDCHTPGYAEVAGKLDESRWLTGSDVGFRGPWGTSYPGNLRLDAAQLTEEQWLGFARAPRLPPMPWFALAALGDEDLLAIYRYIRSLGPAGAPAPAAAAPGVAVRTPFIVFEPTFDPPRVAGTEQRAVAPPAGAR